MSCNAPVTATEWSLPHATCFTALPSSEFSNCGVRRVSSSFKPSCPHPLKPKAYTSLVSACMTSTERQAWAPRNELSCGPHDRHTTHSPASVFLRWVLISFDFPFFFGSSELALPQYFRMAEGDTLWVVRYLQPPPQNNTTATQKSPCHHRQSTCPNEVFIITCTQECELSCPYLRPRIHVSYSFRSLHTTSNERRPERLPAPYTSENDTSAKSGRDWRLNTSVCCPSVRRHSLRVTVRGPRTRKVINSTSFELRAATIDRQQRDCKRLAQPSQCHSTHDTSHHASHVPLRTTAGSSALLV